MSRAGVAGTVPAARAAIRAGVAVAALLAVSACGPDPETRTVRLASLPAGTPAGATVYVAGDFNGWDPRADGYALAPDPAGGYSLTLPDPVRRPVELKFTLGSWARAESDGAGGDVPNRRVDPAEVGSVYEAEVAGWRDPCAWPLEGSTATASVRVLRCDFPMPQLDRDRRVWVYLPPGYEDGTRRYPVLYMHDGQNVFDERTGYSGEWGVDETLDSLVAGGDPGVIVVAVDNGQARRLDEYSPWANPSLDAGGEGEEYVRFLVETLKPAVDSTFRTLPERSSTAVAGSSMGGLISIYALAAYPEVFGAAGVFSPAFWFAPDVHEYVRTAAIPGPGTRVYMVTGGREEPDPEAYVRGHERMAGVLEERIAARGGAVEAVVRPEGTHSEAFWRQEFPAAYRWLFARAGAGNVD